ncbi:MAG: hypothetical protein JW974_02405 [Alphaproteobacteria bacterium]|nr:hypothetical protein [Alphaproteobacteria bacterium]
MSDYENGYMKPPVDKQFQPGQSGNPKGRPRGSKNTYKLLDDILNQKVQMTQDGKQVKINKKTAILLQAANKAAKGDMRAIQTLFPHMLAADIKNEEHEKIVAALSQDDQKLIEQYTKSLKGVDNE